MGMRNKLEELYQDQKEGKITKLKYYQLIRGITVKELAERAGVSKRTMDNCIRGNPPINTMKLINALKVAEILDVSIYDIIER